MKKNKSFKVKKYFIFFSFLLIQVLTSCSDYTDLINDFNSLYQPVDDAKTRATKIPGTSNFDENGMLEPKYFVVKGGGLSLKAPDECDSYSWTLYADEIANEKSEILLSKNSVNFTLEASKINLEVGTYKLVLKITKDEITYSDKCDVVIYEKGTQ